MTDQLYLAIWLDRAGRSRRLKHFSTLLHLFPFSQRDQPQSTVSVQAIAGTEPPLFERALSGPIDLDTVASTFREYSGEDVAYEIEGWWDLWQLEENDWKLVPARITLSCFNAEFDNGTDRPALHQEDLRIDFGVDSYYLPLPEVPGSARMVESNVKSLLRLVHAIESSLPVEKRVLETESGENFADRLQHLLIEAASGRPN